MGYSSKKFNLITREELFLDVNLLNSLIECYIEIYKEWNEEYNYSEIKNILLKI